MIIRYPELKLAAGHNQAGSLASIETLLAIEGLHPFPYGTYRRGNRKLYPNGMVYNSGFSSFQWPFAVMMWAKHPYMMTTFCNGGESGLVTVRTNAETQGTYANYNATMVLPQLPEVRTDSQRFEDYIIQFINVVAI